MFNSPKNSEFAIGWNNCQSMYINQRIEQKRNRCFTLLYYDLSIKDLGGLPTGGLKNLADSVGIETINKSNLDQ